MSKSKTTNINPVTDSGTEPAKKVRWGRRAVEFANFTVEVKTNRLSGEYKISPFISALCRIDGVVRGERSNSCANLAVVTQILDAIGVPFPADDAKGRNVDCKPNVKTFIAARIWTAIHRPTMLKCELNEHDSSVLLKLATRLWKTVDKIAAEVEEAA